MQGLNYLIFLPQNLYQDGKVCLSLLGTFHAQDESQQWNPGRSSLAQVLVSIQTQLLSSDPYFNEPGHERMASTSAGVEASRRYNISRRLDTLRHATLAPLLHPPEGFVDVVRLYFELSRQRILVQAKRWVIEAKGSSFEARYEKVFAQLAVELARIGRDSKVKPLQPRKEDVAYLRDHDAKFWSMLENTEEENKKPAASSQSATRQIATRSELNPWAGTSRQANTPTTSEPSLNPWISSGVSLQNNAESNDCDNDDEDYYS